MENSSAPRHWANWFCPQQISAVVLNLFLLNAIGFAQDYSYDWIGRYNGSSDVVVTSTGGSYTNRSTVLEVERRYGSDVNKISFMLKVVYGSQTAIYSIAPGFDASFAIFNFYDIVSSNSAIDYTKSSGNRRWHFQVTKSGSSIAGTITYETVQTNGSWILGGTVVLNMSLDPTRKYNLAFLTKTPASMGISGANISLEGFSGAITTGSDGRANAQVLFGWSGHVVPSHPDYSFSPKSTTLHSTTANNSMGFTGTKVTSAKNEETCDTYRLNEAYPNPFNPTTTIRYALPNRSYVSLVVLNSLGQQVSALVHGERDAGNHEVTFDGTHLPSGVYFYRLLARDFMETRALLLIR